MSIKSNKSFQFIVGAFCIVLAWKLYQAGFVDVLFAEPGESGDGVESISLLSLAITGVVSSVQLIGLLAIMLISGFEKPAIMLVEYLGNLVSGFTRKKTPGEPTSDVDVDKLASVLEGIEKRLASLEEPRSGAE